jgi:hypothetical protein
MSGDDVVEIIRGIERRRRWSLADKLQVVAEVEVCFGVKKGKRCSAALLPLTAWICSETPWLGASSDRYGRR